MLTKNQKKSIFSFLSIIFLFILPILFISIYLFNNRSKVVSITPPITKEIPLTATDTSLGIVSGTYPITYLKPEPGWNHRVLSDKSDFGKIKTEIFEIFKGDIVMRVNIVEEDITALRTLERVGDQKLSPLDNVLEYKEANYNTTSNIDKTSLFRVPNSDKDNSQTVLSNSKFKAINGNTNYLLSLDLFPEYTAYNKNSRIRTKINYLPNEENNYKILDSIIPTLKLENKILNP